MKKRIYTERVLLPSGDWRNQDHSIKFPKGYDSAESMELWEVQNGGINNYNMSLSMGGTTIQEPTPIAHFKTATNVAMGDRQKALDIDTNGELELRFFKEQDTATPIEIYLVFTLSKDDSYD